MYESLKIDYTQCEKGGKPFYSGVVGNELIDRSPPEWEYP